MDVVVIVVLAGAWPLARLVAGAIGHLRGRPSHRASLADREVFIDVPGAVPDDVARAVLSDLSREVELQLFSRTLTVKPRDAQVIVFESTTAAGHDFVSTLACDAVPGGTRCRYGASSVVDSVAFDQAVEQLESIEASIHSSVLHRYPDAAFAVGRVARRATRQPVRSVAAVSALAEPPVARPDPVVRAAAPLPLGAVARLADSAGWGPDPSGCHESRYWNGVGWTEYVLDRGKVSVDWQRPRGVVAAD